MIRAWSLGGRCPEPHLSPDLAVATHHSPGDVHRATGPGLEGGGAGGRPCRQVIKDGDMIRKHHPYLQNLDKTGAYIIKKDSSLSHHSSVESFSEEYSSLCCNK